MPGVTAAIFFEIIGHAASSLLWGLMIAAMLVGFVVFLLRGFFPRIEITPAGWIGLAAYGLLILVLATIMAGAIKLDMAVGDIRHAMETSMQADIPSWLADRLGDTGAIGTITSEAGAQVTGIMDEISASLRSTAWKTAAWSGIFTIAALAIGGKCASTTGRNRNRRSARQSARRTADIDDF